MFLSQPIPLEIILLVLSFLDPKEDKDSSALVSCGLVSRAFVTESRSRAFRTIRFTTLDEWRVPSFFALLDSPHCTITKHVASLECYGSAGLCLDENLRLTEPRRWQANILANGIAKLGSLRSLQLQSIILDECITPDVIQLFVKQLRASKITTLHLQLITFKAFAYLCDIIAAVPGIEKLAIRDCFFYDVGALDEKLYEEIVPSSNRLREFMLCWSEVRAIDSNPNIIYPSPLSWLLKHGTKMPHLEAVSIHVKSTRLQLFEEAGRFLELLGPTLKSFDFQEYLPHGSERSAYL